MFPFAICSSVATSDCSPTAVSATPPRADGGTRGDGARTVAVAFSGGRDSTALLHATIRQAAALGLSVLALHVDHGLHPAAERWRAHCAATCRRWARRGLPIAFASRVLQDRPAAGESVEAWARSARYRALAEMAAEHDVDLVLLAHHRRDQAETFLLQALRGGGVAALAAMPERAQRGGVTWARPWLAQSRDAIEAYVRRHRLHFVDDDSNGDDRFARNRLRLHVWPALVDAFGDAETTLAAAAARIADAAAVLAGIEESDLASVADARGLDLVRWRGLPPERGRHVLLAWLRRELDASPPATLVERLMREALPEGARRWPIAGGELHSYRGRLVRHAGLSQPSRAAVADELAIDLSCPGMHPISTWHGAFRVDNATAGGVALRDASRLVMRARAPGDRFQLGPRRPPRSLKLQYQTLGVAPALRAGPIVWREDGAHPVFVPGLGIDARARAPDGEPQVVIEWLPAMHGGDGAHEVRR